MAGRTKIPRNISIDMEKLVNKHMGPIWYTKTQLKKLPTTVLYPDEVQALARRDVEGLNMLDAAQKMWVSKTVYSGIYTSARIKLSSALIHWELLVIENDTNSSKEKVVSVEQKSDATNSITNDIDNQEIKKGEGQKKKKGWKKKKKIEKKKKKKSKKSSKK